MVEQQAAYLNLQLLNEQLSLEIQRPFQIQPRIIKLQMILVGVMKVHGQINQLML